MAKLGNQETSSYSRKTRSLANRLVSRLAVCALGTLWFAGLQGQASASTVIFSDNFNAENGGAGQLNYFGLANWTVTVGSVDLLGNGFYDFLPGNGLYIDLDGTTGQAGTMVSKSIPLGAGTYDFGFELAGSQRGPIEPVTASVTGTSVSQVYSLPSAQGFTQCDLDFTLASPESVQLSFAEVGNSDEGELLDNVSLSQVPEPSSLGLIATAAAGVVTRRSRRTGQLGTTSKTSLVK